MPHNSQNIAELSQSSHLTARGKRAVRVGLGSALVGAVIAGGAIAHENSDNTTESNRLRNNVATIRSLDTVLDATVYLGKGVNVRKSMNINNGIDDAFASKPDNIKFTVGEGKYSDNVVVVTLAGVKKDSHGDQWLVFDEPGTQNDTLAKAADHLGYVDWTAIQAQLPPVIPGNGEGVVIDPPKDGTPVRELTVQVKASSDSAPFTISDIGNGMEQPVAYPLNATTIPANGK